MGRRTGTKAMKKILMIVLGLVSVCSTQAQLFTSEGLTGAASGAILGAIIGGRHAGEGAAIGAGAGFVLGSIAHEANRDRYYSSYSYGYPSYGYGHGYHY